MVFLKKKTKSEDATPKPAQRASSMPSPSQDRRQDFPAVQPHPGPREDFRPVVLSIQDQEWVHQRLLLVYGRAGPDVPFEGQVVVDHHNNSFPAQSFPVTDSHFKAMVHLVPGPNTIKITFIPPPQISPSRFTSRITLHYLPLLQNPPLHLAIVLAHDSEGQFEGPLDRPNGIDEAVKKLRVAGYLWQMYTAEQLFRNFPGTPGNGGSARRSFRLEEEWGDDTLSLQESDAKRTTAKIHVVRSELSVADMREEGSRHKGKGVKVIVREALEHYGGPFKVGEGYKGPKPIVLCLLLDSHWRELMGSDKTDVSDPQLRLGVFISRTLWSWPGCLEEIVPFLQDDAAIAPMSPGLGQSGSTYYGSSFEAATAGLGGMLRELGFTFDIVPEEPGLPIRNLSTFHRTFITNEGQNSRTQLQGLRPCLPAHESSWHRLDCIQFRYDQCFRLPIEPAIPPDEVLFWPCENGIIVTAPSGIILILIRVAGKKFPVAWFEYPDRPEKEVFLFESDIVERMPMDERQMGQEISLEAMSAGDGRCRFDWRREMKEGRSHIPQQGAEVFRSRMVGKGRTEGSKDLGYFIFNSQFMTSGLVNLRMSLLRREGLTTGISHSRALYSIEFQYADNTSLVFGTPHHRTKATDIPIDADGGEMVTGFVVRAGEWIDAIKVITNKKQSAWLGDLGTSRKYVMTPPQGYEMIGIFGRVGVCCDGFGVVYSSTV